MARNKTLYLGSLLLCLKMLLLLKGSSGEVLDYKDSCNNSDASSQLLCYRSERQIEPVLTTDAGTVVLKSQISSINKNLIRNEYFLDSMTHLDSERIPERVVHGNGAGGFGYFEVTDDISDICAAKFLSHVGKRTPVSARFSPVGQKQGGYDTTRDARGFAVRFDTEDGLFDMVGLNMPVFVIKDPILFFSFAHSVKKNPVTNLMDENSMWDFITLRPETLNIFMRIFSDGGIPDGYQHMPGFSIHTYQMVNATGSTFFTRFHFVPDAGVRNLMPEAAARIAGEDPDYETRSLYNAIASGAYPSWTVYFQVLTPDDVRNAKFDVFDVTMNIPTDLYPLRKVGKVVLNRNQKNFFAEMEQLAFCPGNVVPGILGAPDKLFEARSFSYRDSQKYRLGVNFRNIPVNMPKNSKVHTYNRDGAPPVGDNSEGAPNFYPNSFNGPKPIDDLDDVELIEAALDPKANNLEQIRKYYTNELNEDERSRLVDNLAKSIGKTANFIQKRALKTFEQVSYDLNERLIRSLKKYSP